MTAEVRSVKEVVPLSPDEWRTAMLSIANNDEVYAE
jgi:hypothetical protein